VSDSAYAAAIAPEIDRVRIAIAHGIRDRFGPLLTDAGVPPSAGQMLGMLRNLGPDRSAPRAAVDEVFIYQPPGSAEAALADLAAAGIVDLPESHVVLTPRGVDVVERMYVITDEIVAELWRSVGDDFAALFGITTTVVDAAADTGGLAFALMAPPYEPAGARIATRFAESLTLLRFHRFDAHIAAWRNAGLTLDDVQQLEDGPRKDAIEAETNARAALPYTALTASERTTLLDALRRLPIVAV
jgi:hypothetical protein